MIIDVIDLNLKTLQFAQKYDVERRRRGEQLFKREYVEIRKVEKIDDNNYSVTAYVEGNYNFYETEIKICGNTITESSCTCKDYENGNLCKHIIATALETIKPQNATTNEGRKKIEKKREEERKKALEEFRKKQEQELKMREYQDKYRYGLEMISMYKPNSNTPQSLDQFDIMDLYDRALLSKTATTSNLATNIKLEFLLELYDEQTLKVVFKIGETRMYVLNNISHFYEAYKNETEIYYGKQLRFIPKRENFNESSKWLFDYIIQYAEMVQYYDSLNKYGLNTVIEKQILLKGDKIDEFFRMVPNKKVLFHCYENSGEKGNELCTLTEEDLEISYNIKKEKVRTYSYYYWDDEHEKISEEYVLRLNISNYLVFFSNKYIYIFYDKKIYKKEKEPNLIKLFRIINRDEYVLIPEDKLDEFSKFVMPKINIQSNNLPAEIAKEGLIVNKLASKVLLDADDQGNIMLELKFCYLNYEFNILENSHKDYVKQNNIVRDIPAEKEVIKRIFMDGFEPIIGQKYFLMKNTDDIYEFLSQKIQGYMNDFEVLVTDKFKNKQIKQPKISNIGIKIDNGLLELDISKINIDISEIKNILKDYQVKKKYYKLKNGDFLDLKENEDLNLLDELETTLN